MFYGKDKMGVFAPSYYEDFRCIAERCRHSCCIDWEICIDGDTYEKYKQIDSILSTVKESEDGACFSLCKDGRCPHLNADGLCDIIIEHGEDMLADICKNHPRFYNYIGGGRVEVGLGIVCEEACRLVLENESPFSLCKIEEMDGAFDGEGDFDALSPRARIIEIIEAEGEIEYKLAKLKQEFEIPSVYPAEVWLARFLSLEILDEQWRGELCSMRGKPFLGSSKSTGEYGKYYERLLTYFVYRHVSTADSAESLRARLGFCILSLEVIRSMFEFGAEQTLAALGELARRYSAEIEYSEDNTEELIFAFENNFI